MMTSLGRGIRGHAFAFRDTTTLVDGASRGLEPPTGLALFDGVVYVSDRATNVIHAYDLTGQELDWLDLSTLMGPRSLGAVEVDAEGRLYAIDFAGRRVLRIAAGL